MTIRTAPGPRGGPIVGSALEIGRDPLRAYTRYARTYGDVVSARFLRWRLQFFFHPEHVAHILQRNQANYSKDLYTYHLLRPAVGNGLVTNDGAGWLAQRRLVQPAFHRERIRVMAAEIDGATARMLDRWAEQASVGAPVDVAEEMLRVTLEIVGRVLFGVDLNSEAAAAGRAFRDINELITSYVHMPLPPYGFPGRRTRRLGSAIATLDSLVQRVVDERRQHGGDRSDVLSILLQDDGSEQGMSDRQVRDEIVTLLFAGHETSASALTWALYMESTHADVETRLHASASATDSADGHGYAGMVLNEAMRLYPPAWSFGRRAVAADEIGGYDVRAGTLVWVSPYITHRHPDFWDRPDVFDPDRFAPECESKRPQFAYFPFSSGPRMCIGSHFAMTEMTSILSAIARSFRLRPVSPPPEPQALITLRPRGPVLMRLHRR